MAITQTTYTGNGSTTNYSFTFEYLKQSDVKVTLDSVDTTAFTFANATTLAFTTAPGNGVAIRIYRDTAIDTLSSTFFPGSAIKAEDLNQNFTQNLYVTQEADFEVNTANTTADTAKTTADAATATANSATTTANSAVTTANSAVTTANNAVTTANTASTNATNAVSTANTASTNASNAVSTANTASTNATNAVNTANTASTNATDALNNSRESDGSGGFISAISKANTAVTTANSATSTANTASTNASTAVATANAASATATSAQNAVNAVVLYDSVTNVSSIPGSPSNDDRIEVDNSTGIESFSPLTGMPSGFTGTTTLAVRLRYSTSGNTWNWVDYRAPDPDARYFTKSSGNTNTTNIATNTSNISTNTTNISTKMPLAGGTFTGAVNFDDDVVVKGDSTNGSGELTLNCENNSHGVKIKGPPHSAAATYTLTLPNNTGTNGQALTTNGSGVLSFGDITSSIITQTDFAYKPSSNSITFNDPGNAATTAFGFATSASSPNFTYNTINSNVVAIMNGLSNGDSVTIDWLLANGNTVSQSTTVYTGASSTPVNSGVSTIVFQNNMFYDHGSLTSVTLTSSAIVNGIEPILNNQVLRYKTATNKWTVDNADVIAICDGGNFDNGSSLATTTTTFDGGSF